MPSIETAITIAASRDKLFALAQDYDARLRWDPFLRAMRFLDGAREAATGVRVWVRARNGLAMTVEYVTVAPPERVAMKMIAGPFFFHRFAGTWLFQEAEGGKTTVTFRYYFKCRLGPLNILLEPLIVSLFRRDVVARLEGLKHVAEETDILASF